MENARNLQLRFQQIRRKFLQFGPRLQRLIEPSIGHIKAAERRQCLDIRWGQLNSPMESSLCQLRLVGTHMEPSFCQPWADRCRFQLRPVRQPTWRRFRITLLEDFAE